MARRSVLLTLAIITALVGTTLIVLYVQGIDQRAKAGQELVKVLVATDVVSAGEPVASAEESSKFAQKEVRTEDMVPGALSSVTSITGLVATSDIYPGEQLIAGHFGSVGDTQTLVIPENKFALSVELSDPERVAGFVNPGSEVSIFVTVSSPSYTRMLLPRVTVIGVGQTTTTSRTVTDDSGAQTVEEIPKTIITLALDQAESEKLIWADRFGDLNFALLSEQTKPQNTPGVGIKKVIPDLPAMDQG